MLPARTRPQRMLTHFLFFRLIPFMASRLVAKCGDVQWKIKGAIVVNICSQKRSGLGRDSHLVQLHSSWGLGKRSLRRPSGSMAAPSETPLPTRHHESRLEAQGSHPSTRHKTHCSIHARFMSESAHETLPLPDRLRPATRRTVEG